MQPAGVAAWETVDELPAAVHPSVVDSEVVDSEVVDSEVVDSEVVDSEVVYRMTGRGQASVNWIEIVTIKLR